jgi:hypothetical protein
VKLSQHLTGRAIPSIEFTDQQKFLAAVIRQPGRTAWATRQMLLYYRPHPFPGQIGEQFFIANKPWFTTLHEYFLIAKTSRVHDLLMGQFLASEEARPAQRRSAREYRTSISAGQRIHPSARNRPHPERASHTAQTLAFRDDSPQSLAGLPSLHGLFCPSDQNKRTNFHYSGIDKFFCESIK